MNASITWTGGSILTCFIMPAIKEDSWGYVSVFAVCAVIGVPFVIWAWSGLNNINQEINKLEKKRKELRNSIR